MPCFDSFILGLIFGAVVKRFTQRASNWTSVELLDWTRPDILRRGKQARDCYLRFWNSSAFYLDEAETLHEVMRGWKHLSYFYFTSAIRLLTYVQFNKVKGSWVVRNSRIAKRFVKIGKASLSSLINVLENYCRRYFLAYRFGWNICRQRTICNLFFTISWSSCEKIYAMCLKLNKCWAVGLN
jgi:hypothetical protein